MAAPNGVRSFFKLTDRAKPTDVIIAGVGRGEEIPVMRGYWPRARIIGVEPLEEHWQWMRKVNVEPDVLIRGALYHKDGETLTFHLNYEPDQRATIYDLPVEVKDEITREVGTISLDRIAETYGPISNALLWLDVEGAEADAMRGSELLESGAIRWVNCELNICPPRNCPPWAEVNELLESLGFKMFALHSVTRNGRQADAIYIRADTWKGKRIAMAQRGLQRKLERLAAGRGRTRQKYRNLDGALLHATQPTNGDRLHTGEARLEASPGQGPA